MKLKVREIECKSAIAKCGFPGGGWAINPYIGCGHGCVYCYARFIKRFTGHKEPWGTFVDVRTNIADILKKQIRNKKYHDGQIFISTVTDPYQPIEEKYGLTRQILNVLKTEDVSVSILTKSALVLRDLDILKQFKNIDVEFTINSLDESWKNLVEPHSSLVEERFEAARKLRKAGIPLLVMMGPYWPIFTDPEKLFKKFKKVGVKKVFTESFNAVGGNWTGVEEILKKHYPKLLGEMRKIIFDKERFANFYQGQRVKVESLSKKYRLPTTIFFGQGHAAKFPS